MSWLTGWTYRKSHLITANAGAGTNYQIKITVHYDAGIDSVGDVYCNSHCKTDFGDIRFTTDDETTELNYWMESKVDEDNAIFWIKVIGDLSTVNKTIYIYYDNSGVSTTSNGINTFLVFDHFDGSVLDTSYWDVTVGSTPTVTGSEVQLVGGAGYNSITTKNVDGVATGKEVRSKLRIIQISDSGYGTQTFGIACSGSKTNWGGWYDYYGTYIILDDAAMGFGYDVSPEVGSYICYFRKQSTQIEFDANGSAVVNRVESGSPTLESSKVNIGTGWYGIVYVDWIFERKFVSPEPVNSTWGTEEEEGMYSITISVIKGGEHYGGGAAVIGTESYADGEVAHLSVGTISLGVSIPDDVFESWTVVGSNITVDVPEEPDTYLNVLGTGNDTLILTLQDNSVHVTCGIDAILASGIPPSPITGETLVLTNSNGMLWCKPISWKEHQDCTPSIRPVPLAQSEYLDADTWVLKPRQLEIVIRLSDREKGRFEGIVANTFESLYNFGTTAPHSTTNQYTDLYLTYDNSAYVWHYLVWISSKDYKWEYSMEAGRYVRWWTITLICDVKDFSGSDSILPQYPLSTVTIDGHTLDFVLDFERTDKHPPMLPDWINQTEAVDNYLWNECVLDVAYTCRMTNAEKWVMDTTLRNHSKVVYEDFIHNIFSIAGAGNGVWVSSIDAQWDNTNWAKPWKVTVSIQANNSEIESKTATLEVDSEAYSSGTDHLGVLYLDELPDAQTLPSTVDVDVGVHIFYFWCPDDPLCSGFYDWLLSGDVTILEEYTFRGRFNRESILTVLITGDCTIIPRYNYIPPPVEVTIDISSNIDNPCYTAAYVTFDGIEYASPYTISKYIGEYSISVEAGDITHEFDHWETTGDITVDDIYANPTTIDVDGNGALIANFRTISITFDSVSLETTTLHLGKIGQWIYSGGGNWYWEGYYDPLPHFEDGWGLDPWYDVRVIWDPKDSGKVFDHWEVTGGIVLELDATINQNQFKILGSGTITAVYKDA